MEITGPVAFFVVLICAVYLVHWITVTLCDVGGHFFAILFACVGVCCIISFQQLKASVISFTW